MTTYNPPSANPADKDSLVGLLRLANRKSREKTDGMLPVKVISYNRTTNRVAVQPQIMILGTSGQLVERPIIYDLPALVMGGGGFVLSFPIAAGDFGWLLANDRDISLFLQTYSMANPNTQRTQSFSDGVFVPDAMRGYTISGGDAAKVSLQNLAGTVKVTLSGDTVEVTAPNVIINGDVTINGDATVTGALTAQGGMGLTGGSGNSMVVTGNIRTVGNIAATGTITPNVP
jgi:hypothetical protein